MKPITEKQIRAIHKLARLTKTEVNGTQVEQMPRFQASQLITTLSEKLNGKNNGNSNGDRQSANVPNGQHASVEFNAARLGQCANLALYGRGIDYFLANREQFVKRVVEIYQLLAEAEGAIKVPHALK